MIEKEYEPIATNSDPNFDLESVNLDGGDHLLVVQAVNEEGEVSEYSEEVVYTQEHPVYSIEKTTLTAIADSVRAKTGKTDPIPTEDLPSEIASIIAGGGTTPSGIVDITENGIHDVTAYSSARVNVPQDTPEGSYRPNFVMKMLTENHKEYSMIDSENGEFYDKVYVDVPSDLPGDVTLEPITITENGLYVPSDGCDGFSEVTVEVEQGGVSAPDYSGTISQTRSSPEERTFVDVPDVTNVSIDMPVYFYTLGGGLYCGGIVVNIDTGSILYKRCDAGGTLLEVVTVFADGAWLDQGYKTISLTGADGYSTPNSAEYTARGWLEVNSIYSRTATLTYNGNTSYLDPRSTVTVSCKDTVMLDNIVITTN